MSLGASIQGLAGRTFSGNSMILDKVTEEITALSKASEKALGSITKFTTALTDFLLAPLANVKALAAAIAPLVALFNPAVVTQFELAMRDTLATVGSMLVPVLQGVTQYVRHFGDLLAGMIPVFQPLFNEIGQFISSFGVGLVDVFKSAAPILQGLSDVLSYFLRIAAQGIAFFAGAVSELLDVISHLFGLTSRFNGNATSSGMATRQTKVSTVSQFAEDVFSSTAKNVYNRGGQSKTPDALLGEIKDSINSGRELVGKIKDGVDKIVGWFERNVGGPADSIKGAANQADDWLGRQLGSLGLKKPW
jgi:hypothetical protein